MPIFLSLFQRVYLKQKKKMLKDLLKNVQLLPTIDSKMIRIIKVNYG